MYGPPAYIERYEYTNIKIAGRSSTIKSIEIWSYMIPQKSSALPTYADDINKGEKRFIFGDIVGAGFYELLYSSEDNGDIDVRMFMRDGIK